LKILELGKILIFYRNREVEITDLKFPDISRFSMVVGTMTTIHTHHSNSRRL